MHYLRYGQQILVHILLVRSIGKRKLWPEISPNKTVGGFFGGVAFGVIVGYFILSFHAN